VSAPGLVTINVALADPIAVDDTYTLPIPPNVEPLQNVKLNVMANDLFPQPDTHIISVVELTSGDTSTVMTIDPADPTLLDFSATAGFRGTVFWDEAIGES